MLALIPVVLFVSSTAYGAWDDWKAEMTTSGPYEAAKNGNLLLNVGPSGGQGTIPPEQLSRLNGFGSWLRTNGGAVYGSRPYDDPQGGTTDGLQVRVTRTGDSVTVVVVGNPKGRRLTVEGLELAGARGTLLADGSPVTITRGGGDDTVLGFARDLAGIYSPAISVPLPDA